MPWDLNLDNYKQIIDNNFIHIGITERLQASVDILAEKLKKKSMTVGTENQAKRDETPSESSIIKFKKIYKLEYAFYDYVVKLNKAQS